MPVSELVPLTDMLSQLEACLRMLDQWGADIAASHLDAAIQNLAIEFSEELPASL